MLNTLKRKGKEENMKQIQFLDERSLNNDEQMRFLIENIEERIYEFESNMR